jgi:hypothetical protein
MPKIESAKRRASKTIGDDEFSEVAETAQGMGWVPFVTLHFTHRSQ